MKKKKMFVIFIIVLVLLIIIGILIFKNNDEITLNTNPFAEQDPYYEELVKNDNRTWIEYLLDNDIMSISVNRVSNTKGEESVQIKKDDWEKFLLQLNNYSVVKEYRIDSPETNGVTVIVRYNNDEGKQFFLQLSNGYIYSENIYDRHLFKLLEKNINSVLNQELNENKKEKVVYVFTFGDGFDKNMFDKYLETN